MANDVEQAWVTLVREYLNPYDLAREYAKRVVRASGGRKGLAAARMRMYRRSLQRMLRKRPAKPAVHHDYLRPRARP